MSVVIGCDFGLSKSGIVALGYDYQIQSQSLIRVKSRAGQRLVDIEAGFDFIARPFDDITIFVEGYAYGAQYQRESLAELGGVMRRYFCLNKLNYWVIPPNCLKYFVTQEWRATKNFMKKRTREKWGIAFKSDDVCDAYGLARLGVSVLRTSQGEQLGLDANEYRIVNDIVGRPQNYLNANTAKRKDKQKRKTKK